MFSPTIQKYLKNWAEPEAKAWEPLIRERKWQRTIVVPCLGESIPAVTRLLQSLERSATHRKLSALVILVINAREDHPPLFHAANKNLLEYLGASLSVNLVRQVGLDILVINRAVPGAFLPEKQGVGLARKIGTDLALSLIAHDRVVSPWIQNTDGDAEVSLDYLSEEAGELTGGLGQFPAARLHPFTHVVASEDPLTRKAIASYDEYLRYFAAHLRKAGSPYGFATIGSTLSLHAEAYAAVRGFPKREAAEDFYLLSKLAQFGEIRQRKTGTVALHYRPSVRVPFGTGASVFNWSRVYEAGQSVAWEKAESFQALGLWLRELDRFSGTRDIVRLKNSLPEMTLGIVEGMNAFSALPHALKTRPTAEGLKRHLHTWFDALKTLQFVHRWDTLSGENARLSDGQAYRETGSPTELTSHRDRTVVFLNEAVGDTQA